MRIPVSSIINYQLPSFVREEYPLFSKFLEQYYLSDQTEIITQNLDTDLDIDVIFKLRDSAILTSPVGFIDSTITVDSTEGFPDNYGLLKIDSEIILYTSKTGTQFLNCTRGFSGITKIDREYLEFSESDLETHQVNSSVVNLSILYLKEFAYKLKKKITPGFEDREFFSELNITNFVKNVKSFYTSKGSDESFRILFGALYGKTVEVIKPRDFLIRPSSAEYRTVKNIVVELIEGDPYTLVNSDIYQDKTDFIEPAQGTIVEVSEILRDNKKYYILGLDFSYNRDIDTAGTLKSEFSIHPKTLSTSKILKNSDFLDVDSTVGFPDSGNLKIDLPSGETIIVQYQEKVINQFLGCSNITSDIPEKTEVKTEDFIYGKSGDSPSVLMRVTGVLGDIDFLTDTYNNKKKEKIKIKTLGNDSQDFKVNNWFFNVPVKYDVQNVQLINSIDFTYNIETIDTHNFVLGDSLTLESSDGNTFIGDVIFVSNEKSIKVKITQLLNLNATYKARKNISKVRIADQKYSYLSKYNSNVQNTYTDYNQNLYVSTPSLPSYLETPLEIKEFLSHVPSGNYTGTDQITFNSSHKFYTGDLVVYKPKNLENSITTEGTYYIYKLSDTSIKLSKSPLSITDSVFATFNGQINPGYESTIELKDFYDTELNRLELKPKNSFIKLEQPQIIDEEQEIQPGTIGLFINGVEALSYKSNDRIFYGNIRKVEVLAEGRDYNILTPPQIIISDSVGFGATLIPALEGSLDKINIINPGFDYLETPIISITGGGGVGARAIAELKTFTHSIEFDSAVSVDSAQDTISFEDDHKFRDNEKVIYKTDGLPNISGLSTNSKYFVRVVDAKKIRLYNTLQDSSAGINTVNLTAVSGGIHSIVSTKLKKKLANVKIVSPGEGYKNKKVKVSGINTTSDEIQIKDHQYSSGEIITYYPQNTVLSGLSSSSSYYVTVVDEDNIKLSGISTISDPDFQFKTKKYINLTSNLVGEHYFNYPEIKVEIIGKTGVSTFANQDFSAKLQPVFSGKIKSVFIENDGFNYGSSNVLNYHKKPNLRIESGKNAQFTPIISGGTITKVLINSPGSDYQQIPDLKIIPENSTIVLTPILSNGKIVEVVVVNGGENVVENSTITAVPKGLEAKFDVTIRSRRINLVQKLIDTRNISLDDGYIFRTEDSLQYSHLYSPRSLRRVVTRKVGNLNQRDLNLNDNSFELPSTNIHSPIIGWAYDGNPIYGPYGYANGNSGRIKRLSSGYSLKSDEKLVSENRPVGFSKGFFIEDFEFTGNGDLDEHNGRFCKTPEFPDGTYAYFLTISDVNDDVASSNFYGYFTPVFPYIIGPTFKNKNIKVSTIFENLSKKLIRNTTPYNLLNKNSSYDYIVNPNKIKEEDIEIVTTKSSTIDKIDIVKQGNDYKINDVVTLSDNNLAKVQTISGVAVTNISSTYSSFYNLEVVPFANQFIGILTAPHNINSSKKFTLNSKYEINKKIIATPSVNTLLLSSPVEPTATTGIVTYFNVSGNLNFPLKENDIFTIESEKIKILSIDSELSRIKVERNQSGTVGVNTYQRNTELNENSRKILFNVGLSTTYNFKSNKEFYFVPSETVGIGTTGNSVLNILNPGLGKTTVTIPNGSIFIKNHGLNSGDVLFYDSKNNQPIRVSLAGIGTTSLLQGQDLFVTKIDNDLIGISTIKSGQSNFYFQSIGTGSTHSFTVNYPDRLVAEIFTSTATVSVSSSTGLSINDRVNVNVTSGVQTSISFYYNDFNKRICGNKKTISSVDVINNVIYSTNHRFTASEKVIYVSASVVGGLETNNIYFVVPLTKDSFKLSSSAYGATLEFPEEINFTSSGSGYFYSINPKIEIIPDQDLVFDVSDSSLSFTYQGQQFSAFELKLFYDNTLLNPYDTYSLSLTGEVGITTANYILKTTDLPDKLYYTFSPINLNISPETKKGIYLDTDQINFSELVKVSSKYSGQFAVVGVTSTSFTYELNSYPEIENYSSSTSELSYTTDSLSSIGPINSIKLTKLTKTDQLPKVISIESDLGKNAVLIPFSSSIGAIKEVKKLDAGFDYTVDYTIRPKVITPVIIKISPLYHIDSVKVISTGTNYSFFPNLILIDSETRAEFSDVKLVYNENNNKISILQNINSLQDDNIEIIPTNNDNGFEIDELTYNSTTKIVTIKLKTPFKSLNEFPFGVNELFYIENVSTASTSRGYNSSKYDYNFFKVLSATPNIGGIGATFTYSLADYLEVGESPGTVDNFYTSGFVIPKKYLPTFEIKIAPNEFFIDEDIITSEGVTGKIIGKEIENNIIKIETTGTIKVGDIIYGKSSNNYFSAVDVYFVEGFVNISSNSVVTIGWKDRVGFLNDPQQRIHDSNYYQYFSYALKSEEDYSNWSDLVDSLNHTAGFKKFGNLLVNSTHDNVGIVTSQDFGTLEIINDLQEVIDVNCVVDFDLGTENYFTIDGNLRSNEIYFNSRRLQDYIESRGNKVLLIDDISDKFKPVEPEENTVVDSFKLNFIRFKKYVISVYDRLDKQHSQSLLLNLLHNGTEVAINQYAINDSQGELGYFDAEISDFDIELLFYPFETSNKIYSVNSFSFNISDSDINTGVINIGNVAQISSNKVTGIGTTTICSISTTTSAAKIILTFSDFDNNSFYSDEINYVHNGSSIVYNSYSELNLGKTIGIGTYSLYYNGGNINVDIHPFETETYDVNVLPISISGIATTTGNVFLSGNILQSSYVGVATTGIPQKSLIYSHPSDYTAGLHHIVIKDLDNNRFSSTEILGMLNTTAQEVYSVGFGELSTSNNLGVFELEYSNISGDLEIYFTSNTDINYQVRIFSTLISKFRRSESLEL